MSKIGLYYMPFFSLCVSFFVYLSLTLLGFSSAAAEC
jgi:hypothetical protein